MGDQAKTAQVDVEKIGDYQVIRLLGSGGMASVYLAKDPAGREVALKVLLPHLANDRQFVERFIHEAKATVSLRHENIVELVSYGEGAGRYYMATELVDGGSLADLLTEMYKLPAAAAAELFAQLMLGIGYAHERGIVHRDLKPANLLLTRTGRVKVADFGIAKTQFAQALTQTGQSIGTPAYMSPEQAAGKPLDPRSDLFTAGVILYEMLSGTNPHQGPDAGSTIAKLMSGAKTPVFVLEPTVPPELEEVVEKLTAKDPAERFSSAAEVLTAFSGYLQAQRARYPGLVAALLGQPEKVRRQLLRDQAMDYLNEAKQLLQAGVQNRRAAALLIFKATQLDPSFAPASQELQVLASLEKLHFGPSSNPKLIELEKAIAEKPDAAGVLQQMAQLYKLEGNLPKAVAALKRYLRLRPKDSYAAMQLTQLTGSSSVTGVSASVSTHQEPIRQPTSELAAGIRTGGIKVISANPAPATAPTASASAPVPVESSLGSVQIYEDDERPWVPLVKKLAVIALVIGAFAWGVKKIGKFIDTSVEQTDKAALAFGQQIQEQKDLADHRRAKELVKLEQAEREQEKQREELPRQLLNDAEAALRAGRSKEAVETADKVIADFGDEPEGVEARLVRGTALLLQNEPAQARSSLRAFMEKAPTHPRFAEALVRSGEAALRAGDPSGALSELDRSLSDHPYSPFATEARLLRGQAYAARGMREDASAEFKLVLEKTGPANPLYQRARDGLTSLGE